MFLRMIYDENLAQAAYLIGCQRTGEAIVIDPERDVDRYLELAQANGLRIVAATETHIHADFLSGVRELAEMGVRAYLSDEGDADWKYQWLNKKMSGGSYDHVLLHDGDEFMIGNIRLRAMHTPGHTPEHLAFLVTDVGGGATAPIGIATGDFVFVGDLGRPDLLETAAGQVGAREPSAKRLFQTVRRLDEVPEFVQVWPGHGAGSACGKALGAVPTSTVGYEKRFSPAVKSAIGPDATERGFVDFILSGQPEPPLYFARMKRENKAGPSVLGSLPEPERVSAKELAGADTASCAVLDTRPWEAFATGHVPGSMSFPRRRTFTSDVGSMVREDEPIYLIVAEAGLEESVRDLVRIGLDDIRGWIEPSDLPASICTEPVREVSPEGARRMIEAGEVAVLDVRRKVEFDAGHLEGATNISHTRLAANLGELPRDKPLLVHCQQGVRSGRACGLLGREGFACVNLAGGYEAWCAGDRAVETKKASGAATGLARPERTGP
ncbi:MAG: hydroxyacylglutathione hydrolase [Phycisphaerales bacterium]|jgi:hydroxyacylglutathione hydrolase